jgi:carbamoyl-phosphate synthase/aspartate carbamoyltransferase
VGAYTDAIVIRHPEKGSAALAAKYSRVPVLNAGDGIGEHPTQAFLDVFTIREELGTVNGLTITIIGDLKNGRTVHSLVKLLSLYDVKIHYVSPESLQMPVDLVDELRANGLNQTEHNRLTDELLSITDVLYVTRVQKERFASELDYNSVKNYFCISTNTLKSAKAHMIVMHPLPRVNEIDPEVDFDQRAVYFRQMKYGLYVRMALLALVLAK